MRIGDEKLGNFSWSIKCSRTKESEGSTFRVSNLGVSPYIDDISIAYILNGILHNIGNSLKTLTPKPGGMVEFFVASRGRF